MRYNYSVMTETTLFGSPGIIRDGEARTPDTRKAIALLAYLAVEGPSVRRDKLAWLLWPDSSQERARATLRRTLTALRGSLGDEALTATRETITLNTDSVEVDVLSFRGAVQDGDSSRVATIYSGEFLEGFSLRDAPDFDDWQRIEADGFRNQVDTALADLTFQAIDAGEPAIAAGHALRRVEIDALNEDAHRSLMLAYAQLSRRSDAIAQFRELVRILDEELAVTPLPDTIELYETIRRGGVATLPTTRPPTVEGIVDESPMAGRDAELERFETILASGHTAVIEIRGDIAAGKTTLLREMARRAAAWDRPVVAARCFEGERQVAYAPVAAILRAALDGSGVDESIRPDVARLLDEHSQPDDAAEPVTDGPGARQRLFDCWAAALDGGGFDRGVLLVDDVHLADAATLEFLRYLANRRNGASLVLVTAGDAVTPALARGRSEIVELLPLDSTSSGRFTDLEALTATERQVLEGVAVIGRALDIDLLRGVVGRTEDEVVDAADRLVTTGVLRATDVGSIEIADSALGDLAYSEMSPLRAGLLHGRAADILEEMRVRPGEAARHCERAGERDRAALLYAAAAAESMARFANADALHHVHSALALGHEERAALHEMAGDLETLEGRYEDALRSYETVAAITTGNSLAAIERKLGVLHLRLGDPAAADSHLGSALAEIEDDGVLLTGVLAARAAAAERAGDMSSALELAAEAVATAEETGDISTEASARSAAGVVALSAGAVVDAASHFRDALRLAEVSRSAHNVAAAQNGLGLGSLQDGNAQAAVGHFAAAIEILERLGDRHRLAAALSNLADAHHADGRIAESNQALHRSAALLADIGGDPLEGQAGIWSLTSW